MRFTLVESIEENKVATIPDTYKPSVERMVSRSNGKYRIVTLPLKTLIDDNNLLNNKSMIDRRANIWGSDPTTYHYKDWKSDWINEPIKVIKVGDKYKIADGHHRVMALYNDGYEEAEVLLNSSDNNEEN